MIPPTAKPVLPDDAAQLPQDGDSPMTGDQADLLKVLCSEAGEPFDAGLTQSQALTRIEALRGHLNTDLNL
ncbi:DUF3072 domain-containing protein [Loktanella salsilacus]|uniref:DUF3072 domain-containing protein n=1 Tax=Loktanella salsilacus TaxID=195913 RepID=UPI0037363CF1